MISEDEKVVNMHEALELMKTTFLHTFKKTPVYLLFNKVRTLSDLLILSRINISLSLITGCCSSTADRLVPAKLRARSAQAQLP
jgi:hypothetical protein